MTLPYRAMHVARTMVNAEVRYDEAQRVLWDQAYIPKGRGTRDADVAVRRGQAYDVAATANDVILACIDTLLDIDAERRTSASCR